jgi:hypothetical protein
MTANNSFWELEGFQHSVKKDSAVSLRLLNPLFRSNWNFWIWFRDLVTDDFKQSLIFGLIQIYAHPYSYMESILESIKTALAHDSNEKVEFFELIL